MCCLQISTTRAGEGSLLWVRNIRLRVLVNFEALLRWERHVGVRFAANQSFVHRRIAIAFSLETRQWHHLPLLDKEILALLARFTDFLELLAHEIPFRVTDALGEGAFHINSEAFWALDLGFHCCG